MSRAGAECVRRSDADAIHTRLGDGAHRGEGHAAGRFQQHCWGNGVAAPHGLAHQLRRHVVQQHDIGTASQRLIQLGKVVHLDFQGNTGSMPLSCRLDGGADLLATVTESGEVIVLDENAVEQAESMVVSATATHGILFQQPPARQCLAGVENPRLQPGNRIDVAAGLRGDAAEVLKEVECCAFAGEDGTHRPAHPSQMTAGLHRSAIAQKRLEPDTRIESGEDHRGGRQSGEDTGRTSDKEALGLRATRE